MKKHVCFFLVLLLLVLSLAGCGEGGTSGKPESTTTPKAAGDSYQKLSGTVKDLAKGDWLILRYTYDGNQKDYSANPASLSFEDDAFQIEMPNLPLLIYHYEWTGDKTMTYSRNIAGGSTETGTVDWSVETDRLVLRMVNDKGTNYEYILARK